jgi:hypothetical protein
MRFMRSLPIIFFASIADAIRQQSSRNRKASTRKAADAVPGWAGAAHQQSGRFAAMEKLAKSGQALRNIFTAFRETKLEIEGGHHAVDAPARHGRQCR